MDTQDGTILAALQGALDAVERKQPTLRLVAAIAHANGVTQSELAAWFDVERKTIYNWLGRFEGGDPVTAARDERRPGRPAKLSGPERERLLEALGDPPHAVGLNARAWTTGLVQRFVRARFGVDYSASSCRRRLREAGLAPLESWDDASGLPSPSDAPEGADRPPGDPWVPE